MFPPCFIGGGVVTLSARMTTQTAGELFAGMTAIAWVISGVCFEDAGRRVGSVTVNVLRMSIALVLMGALCQFHRGMAIPWDASRHTWGWLLTSGFIGFFVCDLCLFQALVLVGARQSLLILSLAPVVAAALDFLVLRAPLSALEGLGMVITLAGVAWVVSEKNTEGAPHAARDRKRGAMLALVAAVMQAVGAITAKIGMATPGEAAFDPLAATFIRLLAGWTAFVIFVLVTNRIKRVAIGIRDTRAVMLLTIGAIVGPVLGVACFLASLQRVQSGVTQTIIATVPVLMIPVAVAQGQDRITLRAVFGAIVAVAGVILLCVS